MNAASHEINRKSWNAVTAAHNSHKGDQARFFRDGGSTLFPEEIRLLGELHGLRLVHLQCNCGQDTLSLAQRGAVVTGVDISDEAIAFAQRLAADSGIAGEFHRADVFTWFTEAKQRGETFDVAFASYGALCWLSDLREWARGVANVLRPGGRLIVVEFHPVAMIFDDQLLPTFDYFGGKPIEFASGVDDYVARSEEGLTPGGYERGIQNFRNPHPTHEFQWPISDVISAILDAGMRIDRFEEFPYSNGCKFFDGSTRDDAERWHLPPGKPTIPQMYAIVATRISADAGQ